VSKVAVIPKRVLQKTLKTLPDWKSNAAGTNLQATYPHPDYITGLVMIARIAVHAEILNHHPDIKFTYAKLTITLTTHDSRGITPLDIKLATQISKLYSN